MITEAKGNLLDAPVDALVNTVNTVGVMGKGIALQFKKAFPEMFKDYADAARRGEVVLGRMHIWPTQTLDGPNFIINFPTKGHWRAKSRLADVEAGLQDLVRIVRKYDITSLAVPPLGCGNGGLEWSDVEPRIRRAFEQLPEVDVRLYAPAGAPAASEMRVGTEVPSVSPGRAALIGIIDRYTRQAAHEPTLIETQKLMYFMQLVGEPLKLRFQANRYGPYADNLRHVLAHIEGHYLRGFGDGSAKVLEATPLSVMAGAAAQAEGVLEKHPQTRDRMEHVLELVEGFESAYGLELLATVHWCVTTMPEGTSDDEVAANVSGWSRRKADLFKHSHVKVALKALREHVLV